MPETPRPQSLFLFYTLQETPIIALHKYQNNIIDDPETSFDAPSSPPQQYYHHNNTMDNSELPFDACFVSCLLPRLASLNPFLLLTIYGRFIS